MRMRDEMIIKCFWSSLPSFTSGRGDAERLETRRRVMRGSDRAMVESGTECYVGLSW